MKQQNLFDKYGGVATIKLILKKFYEELLNRKWAKKMFVNVDMEKLLLHQIQFVSFAMGKPESEFDDQRLKKGHAGLKITQEQYEETIHLQVSTLKLNFCAAFLISFLPFTTMPVCAQVRKGKSDM